MTRSRPLGLLVIAGLLLALPLVLTPNLVNAAIKMMIAEGIETIPIVDSAGKATAVLRTLDVIHFLAQAFPEQALNLPPRPNCSATVVVNG